MAVKLPIVCLTAIVVCLVLAAAEPVYRFSEPSHYVTDTVSGRVRGTRDDRNKDFILGGLFPIHSEEVGSGGTQCGEIRTFTGLNLMEAMLFALDSINADENLLPNLTLGYDIRDTCYTDSTGLDEALELILVGADQFDICDCASFTAEDNATETTLPTRGIVGALASRVSLPVATLGRLFQMPQISYASTSALLSDRERYTYFYRTVPPDSHQVRAMVALMLTFEWTYISSIYANDAYGEPAAMELRTLAAEHGICIDLDEPIGDFSQEDYQELAGRLNVSRADVVVVITAQQNAELLLREVAKYDRKFIWIASDAWAEAIDIIRQYDDVVAGMFGILFLTHPVAEYDSYFSQLTVDNNKRNPWFAEFHGAVTTGCTSCSNSTPLVDYDQESVVPLVVDATYALAYALQNFLTENCDYPLTWDRAQQTCAGQNRSLTGSTLLEYLHIVSFENSEGNSVEFDDHGDLNEGAYQFVNYQAVNISGVREFRLEAVGEWRISASNDSDLVQGLRLDDNLQFGISSSGDIILEPPPSGCMRCSPGEYRRLVQSSCCGICDPCLGQNYSESTLSAGCLSCLDLGEMWGNNPLQGSSMCVPIPETSIEFSDPASVVAIIVSLLGLITVAAVAVFFGVYWKSTVIKASGREQMVLLLVGITLSFIFAFIYVSPPSTGICGIQRFGLWLCFSLMFGALLVKIIRVARIFLQTSITKVRFTEPQYQIPFTLVIVVIQMMLVIASIAYEPPGIERDMRSNSDNPNDFPSIVVTCIPDSLAFLLLSALYETLLVIAATVLGIISYKYPENFNEAKHICFSTFALLIVWLVFIPSYFATARSMQELQNAAISLGLALSAFAILACLFVPRVYLTLFQQNGDKDLHSNTQPGGITLNSINIPSAVKGMFTKGSNGKLQQSPPANKSEGTGETVVSENHML